MIENTTKEKRLKLRPLVSLIYVILIIAIVFLLFKELNVERIGVDLKYGEEPVHLMSIIDKLFKNYDEKKISLIFIFNRLPVMQDVENIGKLFNKHRTGEQFFVIFHKKFSYLSAIGFPHRFVTNSKIECNYMGKKFDRNYFLLLEDKKVKHVDDSIIATDIHFIIEKHLHPEKGYKHYAISNAGLKKKLIGILNKGGINLLNINDSSKRRIDSFEKFQKIYVITSKCTACELKRMIADFKMRQVLDAGNDLVIFPIFADEYQLKEIIKNENLKFQLYLDCDDGFDLFSIIPNPKDNFIVIDNEDIKEPEVNR